MCKFELDALMWAQRTHEESTSQATPMLYTGWAILGNSWHTVPHFEPGQTSQTAIR